MNILACTHIGNKCDKLLFDRVLLLSRINNSYLTLFCNSNELVKTVDGNINITTQLSALKSRFFDVVIAIGIKGFEKVKEFVRKEKLPLVYVVTNKNGTLRFPESFSLISHVVVSHKSQFLKSFFYNGFVNVLSLPLVMPAGNTTYSLTGKVPVLLFVATINMFKGPQAIQMVRLINFLTGFKVKLVLPDPFPNIFNSNTDAISINDVDIDTLVSGSDIVIGEGEIIEKAILFCKPAIIVGERGYGGILTKTSFTDQYKSAFQGRIGGGLEEHIPEKLIIDDILNVIDWGNDKVDGMVADNFNLLENTNKEISEQWNGLIKAVVEKHNAYALHPKRTKLKLNQAFKINKLSETSYVLSEVITRKYHSTVEREECDIIRMFQQGKVVEEALTEAGYDDEPEVFFSFIDELVKEKILITDGR